MVIYQTTNIDKNVARDIYLLKFKYPYIVCGYFTIDFNMETEVETSPATCLNCYSSGTKFFDSHASETICRFCGVISEDFDNSSASLSESYRNMENMSVNNTDNSGSLSGSGSSIITSYERSMDFSKSGILSGHISKLDSNSKRVGISYSKLIYTERNSFKSTSANREVNITEGLTTILKITDKLKIPHHIGERAANIFRMFYPKDKIKKIKYVNITNLLNSSKRVGGAGGNDKNVSAKFVSIACIYFALRESQDITSLIEFVNIIMKSDCIDSKMYTKDVIKKIINKIYNIMTKEFDLEISYPDTRNTINHICNSYSIDETIKRDSIYLYEVINSNISVFQGTAPRTIAIVLIYISFIRNRRVPTFIKKTDLSIITLKKLYNKYLDNLFYTREINEGRFAELKEGLDNGYKNKVINPQQQSVKVGN